MIKEIKKQFVLVAALVISIIIALTLVLSYNRISGQHFHRYVVTGIILIIAVVIGSMLISNLAIRPIQKTWQQQLDFTADASHELRTPLAVIQSNLEIVMEAEDTTVAQQMKWLKNIESESHRMAELVDALLTLSRADTGTNQPQLEDLPLFPLINIKKEAFSPLAGIHHIDIQTDIPEDMVIHADRSKIEQLFAILIDNAIKYMGRPGTIFIKAYYEKKDICIKVIDTGMGIATEDLPYLFQRFYRADKSRSNTVKGTGLGLSIAQIIVQEHKGEIHVESTPEIGTTFTIYLPGNS